MEETPERRIPTELHQVDIQWGIEPGAWTPRESDITAWVNRVLELLDESAVEVSIRMVGEQEMAELNGRFRNKTAPTNVLSFPVGVPDESGRVILGDVVLCAPVVVSESEDQNKPLKAHFAHMIVHGLLHLKGYDHLHDEEAREMEAMEVDFLSDLGFADPYEQSADPDE